MDFRARIRMLAQSRRALEIGPSYNPILPKRDGFRVETLDHADRDTLVAKYGAFGIDTSRIEEVDHVTTDVGSLRARGPVFDLIVGSHVIEHVTDLIRFVNDCDSLLADDGMLALIVPDKRYCFDAFRPLTSPGAVIDAHHSARALHVGALYDHYAYFCRNHGEMAWSGTTPPVFEFPHSAAEARSAIDASLKGSYVDAHEWVFVPASFRFVVAQLRAAGFVRCGILERYATRGYEFFALLSRTAPPEAAPLPEMLAEIQAELAETDAPAIESIRQRTDANEAAFRSLKTYAERLEKENSALRASTSWRVTRPVRALGNLVRRLAEKQPF